MLKLILADWRLLLPKSTLQRSLLCFDAMIIPLLLWAAFSIRLQTTYQIPTNQLILFIAAPLISIPVFIRLGLYRAVIRYLGHKALWTIVHAVTVTTMFWAVLAVFATHYTGMPRSVLPLFWLFNIIAIGSSRLLIRHFYLLPTKGASRAIIWGAGSAGAQLAGALRHGRELIAVAFIDDDERLHGQEIAGVKVHPPSTLQLLAEQYNVEELLIAIPSVDQNNRRRILRIVESLPLHVRVLPGVNEIISGHVTVSDLQEANIADLLTREEVAPEHQLMRQNVHRKVVLITGAGGSIGSEICRQILRQNPQRLVMVEHSEHALYTVHQSLKPSPDSEIIALLGSVQDADFIRSVMSDHSIDTVYHAAAYKHVAIVADNPIAGIKNNVFGTQVVAEAAVAAGIETFVLISTDKAVRPSNVMGASKRVAEMVVQAMQDNARKRGLLKTRFEIVRFGNVLASSGSVVPLFREQIAKGGPVTVTHPDVTRFLMSIPEAAALVIQAGALGEGGDVFVLDMGRAIKIDSLARSMIQLTGKSVRDLDNPQGQIEIQYIGLRPGDKLHEELFLTSSVTATRHPKILRSEEKAVPWSALSPALEQLRIAVNERDNDALDSLLRQIIDGLESRQKTLVVRHSSTTAMQTVPKLHRRS